MKSMKVKDYMAAAIVTLRPDMNVLDAVHVLIANRISGAPVIDDLGELVGVLSERDCLKLVLHSGYHGEAAGLVSNFMSREVMTVRPDENIVDLARRFMDQPYRRYPVVLKQRVVGIISRRDVLRALLAQR